jgi:phosphoglycerate dehydrogenase-like enzyme
MKSRESPTVVLALKTPIKSIDFPDEMAASLMKRFPNVTFHIEPFHPQHVDNLKKAQVLYAYTITPTLLAEALHLKWFHSVLIGTETYDLPELIKRGIMVTAPRGVYSIPIAESALGLMLAHIRKIRDGILAQNRKHWATVDIYESLPPARELYESTVAIIGVGSIGTALAERCHCLGMRVIGVVPTERKKPKIIDEMILTEKLHEAIKIADFVVITCPLTKQTKKMIGTRELSIMKHSAYLINMARGEIVDETALVKALTNSEIGGAACDVFSTEPLPADHPFYSAPNMIVMPHVSGWSTRFWERAAERFAANLELYLQGKPLVGLVDFKRGY